MKPNIRHLFDTVQPLARDYTGLLNFFDDTMSPNKLIAPEFCKTIRQTSFPAVCCPMNCMVFPDFKSKLIPLNHYLRFIQDDFRLMKADASWFIGKNPSWPNVLNISNIFNCMPAITISEDLGICVIACSEMLHSIKSTKYLHPPLSPIMTLGSNRRDAFAKVTVVPNLVRTEKVSAFNHSFRVVKLKGTTIGMSCFQLQSNPDDIPVLTNEEENTGSILLNTRFDVRQHISEIIGDDECRRFDDQFHHLLTNTNLGHRIEQSKTHASFLSEDHLVDYVALELRADFRKNSDDYEQIDDNAQIGQEEWILRHVLYPVLSNETFGHKSYQVPREMGRGISSRNSVHLFMTLFEIFMNVPEIFTCFLQKQYNDRNKTGKQWLQIYRNIKTAQERSCWICSDPKKQSLQKLENEIDVVTTLPFEQNILNWLAKNCENNLSLIDPMRNLTVDDMLKVGNDNYSHCLIANCAEFYNSPNWKLLETANFYPVMFLKLDPSQNGIKFLHRWGKQFSWQTDDYVSNTFKVFSPGSDLTTFIRDCDIIVFKRPSSSFRFLKDEISKMCHIQDAIKCKKHNENLAPISQTIPAICCFSNCLNQPKLKCCHGIENNTTCSIAVCSAHLHECEKSNISPVFLPITSFFEGVKSSKDINQQKVNLRIIRNLAKKIDKETTKAMTGKRNNIIPGKFTTNSYYNNSVSDRGTMPGHYLTNTFMRIRSRAFKFKKPPVFSQTCLQRMHSSSTTKRSALIQPESDLFPSQFWYGFESNSIAGALPFTQYKNADKKNYKNSLASVNDHSFIRIRNGALWQSKCPNYRMWAFDVIMNSRSQFYPISQIMKKGPEILCPNECLDGFAISLVEGVHSFDSGGGENHRGVNELAAMSRNTGAWRYFYTLTCNDSKTPGVAELYDKLKQLYGENSESYQAACVSSLPIALMIFERFVHYMLNYIQFSPQKPLGPVTSIVARREFQDDGSLGNKPHVHIGITIDPSEPASVSKNRIRAIPSQVFNEDIETDYKSMFRNKWVKNYDEFMSIQMLFTDLHKHDCKGTGRSKRINFGDKRKDVKCRVPHFPNSFDYDFKSHDNLYPDDVLDLLVKYGLASPPTTLNCVSVSEIARGKPIPIDELRGGRITYPCHEDEQHSPTVPLLFLCSLSSTNVQMCDFRFQMSYLFKYSVGKEHHRETEFSANPKITADNLVNVGIVNQYNKKSGGESVYVQNTSNDDWQREIGDAETTFVLLNCSYISSTMKAIHIPTLTSENRTVLMKYKKRIQRTDYGDPDPPGVKLLRGLVDVRQRFTENQLLTIEDWYISNTGLDRVQAFSIRPPILRSFDMIEIYTKCFLASGVPTKSDYLNATLSPLVDGANRSVKIRICHLDAAIDYLKSIENETFQQTDSFSPKWLLEHIFLKLKKEFDENNKFGSSSYSKTFRTFVNLKETTPVAVVFPKIRVEDARNFLYHLLLINSRFITELDLVCVSDWRKSFTLGNVLPDRPSQLDILNLTKKYILEHLIFQPITTGAFGRSIKRLDTLLPDFFSNNEINHIGQPLVLTRSIKEKFSEDFQTMLKTHQSDLATCLVKLVTVIGSDSIITSNLPLPENILNGSASSWIPVIPRKVNQSDESYIEQCEAFQIIKHGIENYIMSKKAFEPSLFATGPPGSGKTFLMCLGLLYAMSRGLIAAVFSLTALRARDLSGTHIHDLVKLRDFGLTNQSSSSIAETTILHLQKHPEKREFLKTVDIFLGEEMGLIGGEQYSAIDKIFRHVKGNPFVPHGGAMFLATGDPQQLPPVKGKPIWLSSSLYTTFRILKLTQFVRSAGDVNLQKVLSLLQLPNLSEQNIEEIISTLSNNLNESNFVESIESIPSHYDVIFGKKLAVAEGVRVLTNRERNNIDQWNASHSANKQIISIVSKALDEYEKSPGDWRKVETPSLKRRICKSMRETDELFLYEGGVMRFTYNGKTPSGNAFSQGQLVVITSIILSKTGGDPVITVALVPSHETNLQNLKVQSNWPSFKVGRRTTEPITLFEDDGVARVQRKQFPLVYAAVTTIHKSMGRTCKYVCTKITHTPGPYQIWQLQLFYVLVSRVEFLKNLLFVGSKNQILETIRHILHFRNRVTEYVMKLLIHLNVLSSTSFSETSDNFVLNNFHMPAYDVACVYLIVSSKNSNHWKIGQTQNFSQRILQHNSVQGGSVGTNEISLKPWIPAAIITGFSGSILSNRGARLEVEKEWHSLVNTARNKTSLETLYLGEQALSNVKSMNGNNTAFSFLKFNSFLHR
jgi:hypothetical protein